MGRHWRGRRVATEVHLLFRGVHELQELLNPATVLHLLESELIALRLNRHQTLALLEEVRVRVGERLLELGHLAGAFLELPFRLVQLGAPDADGVEATDELVALALEVRDAFAIEVDELRVGVELAELPLLLRVCAQLGAPALGGVGAPRANLGLRHRERGPARARCPSGT